MDDRGCKYRKRIRLPHQNYDAPGTIWLITTVTDRRQSFFSNAEFADEVCKSLEFVCRDGGADLLAYVLMPNHLHAIVMTTSTNVMALMQRFKSYTAHQWKNQSGISKLWQDSFYDEGLRQSADIDRAVRYLLDNPVRAQLVTEWEDWQNCGGSLISNSHT